ncbi:MAG: hypothetical protein ACPGLV_16945, partial [Bacteroidia bacterium]
MKRVTFLFLLLTTSILAFGQKNATFSETPEDFYKEFSDFLKNAKNKNLNITLDEFDLIWQ